MEDKYKELHKAAHGWLVARVKTCEKSIKDEDYRKVLNDSAEADSRLASIVRSFDKDNQEYYTSI